MCRSSSNELEATIKDDWGVFEAGFYVDNQPIGTKTPESVTRSFNAKAMTDLLAAEGSHTVRIVAVDIAYNTAVFNDTIIAWPDHCCNGLQDQGETGVDCGGTCSSCEGGACAADKTIANCQANSENCRHNLCSSNFCGCEATNQGSCANAGYGASVTNCCLCVNKPIIDWIVPVGGFCDGDINRACQTGSDCAGLVPDTCNNITANGAPNNLVTIGGKYFGDFVNGRSRVYFSTDLTGNNFVEAQFANQVNNNCTASWNNNQVIVAVPQGISARPVIRIVAENGYDDTTGEDGRGPQIDFVRNTIARPGICQLSRNNGVIGTQVTYYGINLNQAASYFGNDRANVPGTNSQFAAQQGTALVPDIRTGTTTTFVIRGKTVSNFLPFRKDPEPYSGPEIISFEPVRGKSGQYVTVMGRGFGNARAENHVYFGNEGQNEASYKFPDICSKSVWSDNQVIVKVPEGIPNGNYNISIKIGNNELITTAELTPAQFQANDQLSLTPSLCRIDPVMGPVNGEIGLWGEYFGEKDPDGRIGFHLNRLQSGAAIGTWKIDSTSNGARVYLATTTVPQDAISGPVNIINRSGNVEVRSNSINYKVGTCSSDAECGSGNICCPQGSLAPGRCKADAEQCFSQFFSCVYELNMSTGYAPVRCNKGSDPEMCVKDDALCIAKGFDYCDPDKGCTCQTGVRCSKSLDPAMCVKDDDLCLLHGYDFCDPNKRCTCQNLAEESCSGYDNNECLDSLNCPNSPGNCSIGDAPPSKTSCDCAALFPGKNLTYDSALDKCVNNAGNCSIDENGVIDVGGSQVSLANYAAQCNAVKSGNQTNYYWQINPGGRSCPGQNWVMDNNNWCTLVNNIGNITKITCNQCDTGYSCMATATTTPDNVGICAYNRDICPGDSTCGADGKCSNNGQSCECCCRESLGNQDCCFPLKCEGECGTRDDFGLCTGCANVGITQAEHDAACNCSGTNGKFCDISGANPAGVCRDCAQLSTADECSKHSGQCCVDNARNNVCRGGSGNNNLVQGDFPDLAYCQYYRCAPDPAIPGNERCDSGNPIASSTSAKFSIFRTDNCDNKCNEGQAGEKCEFPNPYNCTGAPVCAFSYSCLTDAARNGDCRCCCDPADANACSELDKGALQCKANQEPCSGNDRGLCCGCTADTDCVIAGQQATQVGCGKDTGCRPRPNVVGTEPADDAGNIDDTRVCRNPLISATFDQKMNISNFSNNVVVLGDYGLGSCQANTKYLADLDFEIIESGNPVKRLARKLASTAKRLVRPIVKLARALTNPSSERTYCAVNGSVTGYNKPTMNGGQGVMEFKPSNILDPDRLYYVIIKGDANLDSKAGALNAYDVAMNGPLTRSFNGITFNNAYIWSFRTMRENAENNGICAINKILVEPRSYLFQKSEDDPSDNNPADPATYDQIRDGDKIFYAYPLAKNGKPIAPVSQYSWSWSWRSENPGIARVTNSDQNSQKVNAQRKDEGKTFIIADAKITADTVLRPSTLGQSKTGEAQVRILVCDNPWPPVKNDLTWDSWRDTGGNCRPGTGACFDNNFEFYYCRDAGAKGTNDDLPAIMSEKTLINGASTNQDFIKEFYFFREALPDGIGALQALSPENYAPLRTGGSAALAWPAEAAKPGEQILKYVVYYGKSPNSKTESLSAATNGTAADPFVIEKLQNGVTYYFSVATVYSSGAEGPLSNEISYTPADTAPPAAVQGVAARVNEDNRKEISLTWDKNADSDTVGYKVYYGTNSGVYGASENVGNAQSVTLEVENTLTRFYFAVSAVDRAGNESQLSTEISLIPESYVNP